MSPEEHEMPVLNCAVHDILGLDGVPYLIAPDGRLHQGVPEDLETWLEGKE